MRISPRVKDRLFSLICLVAAAVVLVVGFSRGNPRVALGGAAILIGYAVLQSVATRLTPGARLLVGSEADAQERLVQFKATRLAGQTAVGIAIVGVALSIIWNWDVGLWVAGACGLVLATFVGSLVYYSRVAKAARSA